MDQLKLSQRALLLAHMILIRMYRLSHCYRAIYILFVYRYVITVYLSFINGIPSEAEHLFDLPDHWPAYCGNANTGKKEPFQFSNHHCVILGFTVNPVRGFVVTPQGGDGFALQLNTPPVRELGDQVKIEFKLNPSWYYNGTKCTTFKPMVFNKDNWQTPQQVDMSFTDYGCCSYIIEANGGGYDWQYQYSSFVVYGCEG